MSTYARLLQVLFLLIMLLKFSNLVFLTLPPLTLVAISCRGKVYIDFLKDISTHSAGWITLFQSHYHRQKTGEHSPLNTVPHWLWQLTAKADLYLLVSFWVCKVWWTQILSFYSGTAKKKHALEETSLSSEQPSVKQNQVTCPNYFSPLETGKAEAVKYREFMFSHPEGDRIKFQKGLNSFSSRWR